MNRAPALLVALSLLFAVALGVTYALGAGDTVPKDEVLEPPPFPPPAVTGTPANRVVPAATDIPDTHEVNPGDREPRFAELTIDTEGKLKLAPRATDPCEWVESKRLTEDLPDRTRNIAILESPCYPDYLYQVDLDTKEIETYVR